MVMRARAQARRAALGGVVLVAGWILSASGPVVADVTAVSGGAYGYFSSVSLFGGPPGVRGPAPQVTLPPAGSAVPITASVPESIVQYGPAILFSSGAINVSTQGTTGPGGSVTSSANVQNVNRSGQELLTASSVSSTCTATETGVSGATTVNNGTVQTSEGDPNVDGDETIVNIPTNPPPNYTVNGQIEGVGDTFQYIFNEQIVSPDGGITVNAVHLRLLGPTAVGDLIVGQSRCQVTSTVVTTTTANPLVCNGLQATIVGTSASETIVGTPGRDVIVGLGGDDQIGGLGGNDVICGGEGNDKITGGAGNDTVLGGPGNDDLVGDVGNDTLRGEGGTNRLSGGAGTDTCSGGAAAGCEA